jgi:hypothetical protein
MTNNILSGAIGYMIGPMDDVQDRGIGFRYQIKKLTREAGVKIAWLDPTQKLAGMAKDVGEEGDTIRAMKENKEWEKLRHFIKRIVRQDLRCCDISDFVVAYINPDCHMCGSYHELIVSLIQKKPVLAVIKGGKERCPNWLFGILHYSFMFDSIEDLVAYLKKLNEGKIQTNERWVLLRKQIKQLEDQALG